MGQFVRRIYEVYKPLRLALLGVFGFIILAQIVNAAAPYLHSKIIDGLIRKNPIEQIYVLVVASLALWLSRTLLQWLQDRYELAFVDFAIPRRMQEVTLSKLFGFSIGQHTNENSGIKRTVIERGENALDNIVHAVLYQIFPLTAEVILLTGLLLYWSLSIGLIILASVSLYLAVVIRINNVFHDEVKKIEKLFVEDRKLQGEVLNNIGLVMANAQEDRAQKDCKDSFGGACDFACSLWSRYVTWAAVRNVIPTIARFIVLIIGVKAVIAGKYSVGHFVLIMVWTMNAVGNLSSLSQIHRRFIQHCTSARRYFDMLAIPPDITVIPNPVRPEKFSGRIEFKNVTFRYQRRDLPASCVEEDSDTEEVPEKAPVGAALDNVSFVIEAGKTVAFVGESGAGKSTLVNAIVRAQDPESGQIIVDGNDLRVLDLKHFRESIGIVNQDVSLFDQTLRHNITYGLNGRGAKITDHELDAIAEMSCVNRFFHRLEKGYDTIIGERGVKLSGGERQRVGIARALIKEPDILIFDEATSSLDSENEGLIQESIDLASKGRTTIIIAHRFSTIRNADMVIVFDKGKVVGQGTHEELAETCETYQRLARNQMSFV